MPEPIRRVVYVTYDGLEDPLGQSQVRPYVEGLARRGHRFEVVSFEKPGVPLRFRERLGDGVRWTALRYHRRPTLHATAFDMLQGLATTALAGLLRRADLLHARSYVAATLALPWAVAAGVPLLFDMRGFWPDEKVESGGWAADGATYRIAKRAERLLLRRADVLTVLTHSMRDYFRHEWPYRSEIGAPIHVIPTCTDLRRFSPTIARDPALVAELDGARVLGYVGSLGTWYMDAEMVRFYLAWRAAIQAETPSPTRFLVVSPSRPDAIASAFAAAGIGGELLHRAVPYRDVPAVARCAEASVCFRRRTFSGRGGAPTKLGEMLACGIPVAANTVGDMAAVLRDTAAGVIVDDMSAEGLNRAARRLIAITTQPDVRQTTRGLAERWFSLEDGLDAYDRVYRMFSGTRGRPPGAEDRGWPPAVADGSHHS